MKLRAIGLLAALFSLGSVAAFAQGSPAPAPTASPAALPTIPPKTDPWVQILINAAAGQVKSAYGWDANRADGVVTYYRRYDLQMRFANGTYRTVHLHRGTVINPRGASIHEGQRIDVQGQGLSDGSLNANVITMR
ncbi:MAG: hypothetical protein NVS1B14_00900 [Vulcanimicrobiaceae bacterium]